MPDQNKKTAFVTGSAGFLGTNLVQQLVAKDWDVIALHRPTSNISGIKDLPIRRVVGDITDKSKLQELIPDNLDAIFHVASSVTYWAKQRQVQFETNVKATEHLVDLALQKKTKRFIHTSTILTYQYGDGKIITEQTPLTGDQNHVNYARTKRLGEIEVEKRIARGLDAVILHPGTIIGAYDFRTWSRMFKTIQDGPIIAGIPPGKSTWCHARKVADAEISAWEKGRCGEHYLLGGADGSFLEVANIMSRLVGKKPFLKSQSPQMVKIAGIILEAISYLTNKEPLMTKDLADVIHNTVVFSSEKAIRELGYNPSSLTEMIEDCYDWMISTGRLKSRK